ncbi:MAG: outer membrane lipoprotein carrier protein LolA [Methylotenera sp.]|nr:MAG: outer membrane lipoprotein carrier protein LolA [Methylotenera sp.]
MLKIKLFVVVSLATFSCGAFADGVKSLRDFYNQTHAMRADFSQIVTDKQGRKVQEVQGEMQLKRPNKFRWDYNKPYEQQIVSDGKQVWLYDTELAQVTVRALSKALGSSPAALLAGDDTLDKSFKFTNANQNNDIDWVKAEPKIEDSGFESILLGFKAGELKEMELIDSFGLQTKISFSKIEQNPSLDNKTFLFKTPKGVDVVKE